MKPYNRAVTITDFQDALFVGSSFKDTFSTVIVSVTLTLKVYLNCFNLSVDMFWIENTKYASKQT